MTKPARATAKALPVAAGVALLIAMAMAIGCPNSAPSPAAQAPARPTQTAPAVDLAALVGVWAWATDGDESGAGFEFQELALFADGRYECRTWVDAVSPAIHAGAVQGRSIDLVGEKLESAGFWVAVAQQGRLQLIFEPVDGPALTFDAQFAPRDTAHNRRGRLTVAGNPVLAHRPQTEFVEQPAREW